MPDNDLIRRGDALALCDRYPYVEGVKSALQDLPAVTVGVPEATVHRAVLDWIRDDAGMAVKMGITPDRASALTARILAALDLTPAPRRYMGQIMAECDCPREAECQAAGRCIAEGRK